MRKSHASALFALLLLLLLLTPGSESQTDRTGLAWIKPLHYLPQELFSLTVGQYGYPYVPVLINGEKFIMAFDTGNMVGLHINSAGVRRLGLRPIDRWTSVDADGAVLGEHRVFQASEVAAFGQVWKDERVYELERSDLAGLIGPRFLQGKRFTLDYRARRLAVSNSPLPTPTPASDTLPLIPSKRYPGMIVVQGAVNHRPVLIQVDTGKSRTCVDRELAAALSLPKAPGGYRIEQIRLGSFSFTVPDAKEVSFKGISQDLPQPILVGIGSDILSQIVLTVDYQRHLLLLSR